MIVRRVVTGHDKAGKSVFVTDGPTPRAKEIQAHTWLRIEYGLDCRSRSPRSRQE